MLSDLGLHVPISSTSNIKFSVTTSVSSSSQEDISDCGSLLSALSLPSSSDSSLGDSGAIGKFVQAWHSHPEPQCRDFFLQPHTFVLHPVLQWHPFVKRLI